MPAFEDDDIPKMKELMDDDAKEAFVTKRKRVIKAKIRLEDIEDLRKAFGIDEEDTDGPSIDKMDGP